MAFTPRHGKDALVYLSTTAAGTLSLIKLTTWSLDMSTAQVDVTSFGDTNRVYLQGLKDNKGSIAGFWDATSDAIFDAADSLDGCVIQLYPCAIDMDTYWMGPSWLSASIAVDVNDAIKITGTFSARGNWIHAHTP